MMNGRQQSLSSMELEKPKSWGVPRGPLLLTSVESTPPSVEAIQVRR